MFKLTYQWPPQIVEIVVDVKDAREPDVAEAPTSTSEMESVWVSGIICGGVQVCWVCGGWGAPATSRMHEALVLYYSGAHTLSRSCASRH